MMTKCSQIAEVSTRTTPAQERGLKAQSGRRRRDHVGLDGRGGTWLPRIGCWPRRTPPS